MKVQKLLNQKIMLGDECAKMTMDLFRGQRGIFGHERNGNTVALASGVSPCPGRGFYPSNLSAPEFHDILIDMLNNGQDTQVKEILNQRTIVRRYGAKLVSQDYTIAFQQYFRSVAACLELAAHYASDWNFKEYLRMQSAALSNNAPLLDCRADKKWATLQSGPLEFTLGRESYDDAMTPTVLSNPKLKVKYTKTEDYMNDFISNCRSGKEQVENMSKFNKKYTNIDIILIDDIQWIDGKQRTEEDAIMVGYNTILSDNPQLNVRHYSGRNPKRVVYDKYLTLPKDKNVFDNTQQTFILNYVKEGQEGNNVFLLLDEDKQFVEQALERLYEQKICSLVVEGGEKTLNKFLEADLWDEANVIVGEKNFGKGVKAPIIPQGLVSMENIGGDILKIYYNQKKS